MPYLLIGALVLGLILWGGKRPFFKRREWRFLSAAAALVAFMGAAYAGVRSEWVIALVLVVMGLWFSVTTRVANPQPAQPAPSRQRMSLSDARAVLGVDDGASAADIKAAYTRLMRMAHPDKGGTAGLASQLNAARDRLLAK
jgi:DnaJ-domain-containing protein 1